MTAVMLAFVFMSFAAVSMSVEAMRAWVYVTVFKQLTK